MRPTTLCSAAGLLFSLTFTPAAPAQTHVRLGVDRIEDSLPSVLAGKRIGLITNHTGRDRNGKSTIDVFASRTDLKLVALFGPEHGIRGESTGRVTDARDEATGVPIYSLFGETEKPTDVMLQNVDALVFDIQDVGVRQYTYLSTMALAMQAAAQKKIPFVVLDRPNPIGGEIVGGNIREPGMESFVGLYPIASRHGMTAGELAQLYNKEFGIGADLHVVRSRAGSGTCGSTRRICRGSSRHRICRPSPGSSVIPAPFSSRGRISPRAAAAIFRSSRPARPGCARRKSPTR